MNLAHPGHATTGSCYQKEHSLNVQAHTPTDFAHAWNLTTTFAARQQPCGQCVNPEGPRSCQATTTEEFGKYPKDSHQRWPFAWLTEVFLQNGPTATFFYNFKPKQTLWRNFAPKKKCICDGTLSFDVPGSARKCPDVPRSAQKRPEVPGSLPEACPEVLPELWRICLQHTIKTTSEWIFGQTCAKSCLGNAISQKSKFRQKSVAGSLWRFSFHYLGGRFGPEKKYLAPPPQKKPQFAADTLPDPSASPGDPPPPCGIFNIISRIYTPPPCGRAKQVPFVKLAF